MPRLTPLAFASLVAAQVCACGGGSTGPSPVLDGNWRGSASGQGVTFQSSFSLHESGHSLNGSGTISGSGVVSCTVGIAGSHDGTDVTMTFTCPGYAPIGFHGTVRENETLLTGTMAGSGFNPLGVDFIKQ